MRIAAVLVALMISLPGCFSRGRNIDFEQAKQLTPGVSTRADAERMFGTPSTVTTPADGNYYLGWAYTHTGLYGAGSGSKFLTLMFKPDGKYIGVAHMGASGADVAPQR